MAALVVLAAGRAAPGEAVDFTVRARLPRPLLPGRASHRKVAVAVVSDGGPWPRCGPSYRTSRRWAMSFPRRPGVLGILLILLVVAGVGRSPPR